MIKTGVDIAEISRFSGMDDIERFIERVFTENEIEYFSKKKNSAESIAGFFAAKEAFSKYLGTGIRGFNFKDIEIRHNELGKPCIWFMGRPHMADLSISHSRTSAIAVVCGEEDILNTRHREYIEKYRALMPKRFPNMHKGDCGRVFVLAGSEGMTGAAVLSARSALRCGSGLLTVGTPKCQREIVAKKLTEEMTLGFNSKDGVITLEAKAEIIEQIKKSDVAIIGPGIGKAPDFWEIIEAAIDIEKPLVIDADGINAICGHIDILKGGKSDMVLTPHPGEMARICDMSVSEIEENREKVAVKFAKEWGVTLLLKGKDTVIASSSGEVCINPTGNSGMATAGMGDVLSGVIGSLMGQGLCGYDAAMLGAFIHGLSGDMAKSELGERGMIAGDVVKKLPLALLSLGE